MMNVADIRQAFLNYFSNQGHTIVPSSPLIPANDPTLLFTNAGMVQFKETFLGLEQRQYQRAATCQRCVRAGGKHNDLENVGYTARHHTFFEMLGNFSFGDYFKSEAIYFAWEFLTQVLQLPPEKLWVTVYEEDEEAAKIWLEELKINPERFSRCGVKDNFWMMGETGPCGPCSEIFYDHGPKVPGGPPGSADAEGDRYIEIWNLVFMQYERDAHGNLSDLPKPSVDTGMGLERLAAVLQGVHSNYEIDLFQTLIQAIGDLAQTKDYQNSSLRVIADHIRACAFLIIDGVVPANEGRGYVLRRIIRRAIRHGYKLGLHQPFFYQLVPVLTEQMGDAYPELRKSQALAEKMLKQEEERFAETLDQGMHLLEQALKELRNSVIEGQLIFKLYDTYGFPVDLTADIARERGLQLDMAGFEQQMAAQRERARAASKFAGDWQQTIDTDYECTFTGYQQQQTSGKVLALFSEGQPVDALTAGQHGHIILEATPFYAEAGGQVGDVGVLLQAEENGFFEVEDTQKLGKSHVHLGQLTQGTIQLGDTLLAKIDQQKRQATARHHSATHLMHAALRQILGEHVQQKGSLVNADRLRFDFSHFEPLTETQLQDIEDLVNHHILTNTPVQTEVMSLDEAKRKGAMALFGEKYAQQVRVLTMGEAQFSIELCGGTHVQYTGEIGSFKILMESGVAAGVRRIEAVAGKKTLTYLTQLEQQQKKLAQLLKTTPAHLEERLQQTLEMTRQAEKEVERLKAKLASSQGSDLASQAENINGIPVLVANLEGVETKQLRETLDQLKNKLGSAIIVLATVKDDKVSLVSGVTPDLTQRFKAGELINYVANQVGGKGGGRPDMAQAGGSDPSQLASALASVKTWVAER